MSRNSCFCRETSRHKHEFHRLGGESVPASSPSGDRRLLPGCCRLLVRLLVPGLLLGRRRAGDHDPRSGSRARTGRRPARRRGPPRPGGSSPAAPSGSAASTRRRTSCAFQVTPIDVDTALRTTTLRVGTARGHWRLAQMSSLPEVIFSVSVSGETCQVHASAWMVRSSSTRKTSRPATAFGTVGVTAMSASAQAPVGGGEARARCASSSSAACPRPAAGWSPSRSGSAWTSARRRPGWRRPAPRWRRCRR